MSIEPRSPPQDAGPGIRSGILYAVAAVLVAATGLAWIVTSRKSVLAPDEPSVPTAAIATTAVPEQVVPRTDSAGPQSLSATPARQSTAGAEGSGAGPRVVDRAAWAALPPLDRVLAATSAQDARWLRERFYPSPSELDGLDLARHEALLASADPRTMRDAVFRSANLLAAHYFRAGDPRWKAYAARSLGPFPAELELLDALAEFDASRQSRSSADRLMRAMARAQVMGLIDTPHHFDGFRGIAPAMSGLDYAREIQVHARQLEHANQRFRRWGLAPVATSPRPAPPWLDGPCAPGLEDC